MSSIPLITHRMLVAAVVQERHHSQPAEELLPLWPDARVATVEVLDPSDWTNPPGPPIAPPAPAEVKTQADR